MSDRDYKVVVWCNGYFHSIETFETEDQRRAFKDGIDTSGNAAGGAAELVYAVDVPEDIEMLPDGTRRTRSEDIQSKVWEKLDDET